MDIDSDEEAAWLEEEKAIEADEAAKAAQLVEEEEAARKRARLEANVPEIFDLANVVADPGLRRPIDEYGTPEIRDKMRWSYLSRGRTRLIGHVFPKTKFGPDWRSFLDAWYTKYDWLEYSVEKDAAYCFHCFLFKSSTNSSHFGYDVFTKKGFKNWKKASENFNSHVGGPSSIHNNARNSCEDFRNKKQSVAYALVSHEEKSHIDYEIRLRAVLGVVRFLLEQGLAFRGHDESSTSLNKGNFREMLDWYGARCKDVADVINENAPGNCQLTSPEIQHDIVRACAEETTQVIMSELGNASFTLLVDESRDVSVKEQMAVMVRFVNQKGEILERLLGVEHVHDTTSASLKTYLDALFVKHNLSMSRLRGQGYDGASKMLATMYSADFSSHDCSLLVDELNVYVDVMKRSPEFIVCDSLSDLALKLVQKRQHLTFPLVYRLITLALTLPVATASVERVFSAMNIIKSDLRNKIGDGWLNNLMICYVEKDIFAKIDDKKIMLRFHSYNDRRGHLPRHFRLAHMDTT